MILTIQSKCIPRGQPISVVVQSELSAEFSQLQLEVYEIGLLNPRLKTGSGFPIGEDAKEFRFELKTDQLGFGYYEIKLIRFHSPRAPQQQREYIDFTSGRDFERQFVEVVPMGATMRTDAEIAEAVRSQELAVEAKFARGVEIAGGGDAIQEFFAIVFLRGMLLRSRFRIDGMFLMGCPRGEDSSDAFALVNETLASAGLQTSFIYEGEAKARSRNDNPCSLVHFPCVRASSMEQVRAYCLEKVGYLVQALSVSRGAACEISAVAVFKAGSNEALLFTETSPYRGNFLGGSISGEDPESLRSWLQVLEQNNFLRFLVNLFKEARAEKGMDFQFLRLWQILEILADSKNFDSNAHLVDFEGNVILNHQGQPQRVRGYTNKVFTLFRTSGIGNTQTTWENVHMWYALRSAVTHHGGIANVDLLTSVDVREWGRRALQGFQGDPPGHNQLLWTLKEDVKLLLMQELHAART